MSTTTAIPQERTGSRLPNPAQLVPEMGAVVGALFKATGNGSVEQTTISLIQLRAGQIVGSTYLVLLHVGGLRKAGESEERIAAVATWRDAPYFTEAERSALALVEAVLQPAADGERVSDELYAQASAHFDDKALATLAMAIGQVNFFVPVALIGKPIPGVSPAGQWTPVVTQ
ncbi:carboxymuconolactone decarboxylase family protein [Nocardia sp. NBC_01503]|uniref:carboxymuconolactone decarboxylase family protein n=1 Tax=Nocardia sp. NBC_01503 TaxID=2975997 RepID=UPI002E7AF5C8|nr:carboxymuconolactone decarboxylase family protein [Nocardia sp. NBC_01503]WTL34057.1 carboxymuconolactone decarboxylase family protein [Nocardia sp. NBC_01503]